MHMVVEGAPPPITPALPLLAMPFTGPSVPWEDLEGPRLHLILPLSPSHIYQAMSLIASHSPFATADGHWELGPDIQAAMVKLVGTMVTKLLDNVIYTKLKAWLSAV